jgi:hypothetical protein
MAKIMGTHTVLLNAFKDYFRKEVCQTAVLDHSALPPFCIYEQTYTYSMHSAKACRNMQLYLHKRLQLFIKSEFNKIKYFKRGKAFFL